MVMERQAGIELPIDFESGAHEALMSIWWTGALLRKSSKTFFHNLVSSDAQFNILVLLKDSAEPLTQNDLSKRLLVDKSNITGLIDRLVKHGLISRNPVDGDRRMYHIRLTSRGQTVVEQLDAEYQDIVKRVMSGLSEAECKEISRLTRKVRIELARLDI